MSMTVIGTCFVDIKGYPISKYIPAGRNSGNVEIVHGGVSRNVVEDIANVELRPIFVSTVDDTAEGADVIQKLQKHKVITKYMKSCKDGMGTWLAIFDNDGDVVASISKRFETTGIFEILEEYGDEIFLQSDCILVEIDMDRDVIKRVFQLAEKYDKKIYAIVSNMSIAVERRDYLLKTDCFVCNKQEAGILFSDNYDDTPIEKMVELVKEKVETANLKSIVVTMGGDGAVYAVRGGEFGYCPAKKVEVKDTTGAGDSFFAGVCIGLNYGKTLAEACEIGTKLAASVIATVDNVCPRFLPSEFGINVEIPDELVY